jgi:Tol biopolymer transport system component
MRTPLGTSSTNSSAVAANPSLSDDGRYAAFESTATDLVDTVSAGVSSAVYLSDVTGGTSAFISAQTDDGSATHPVISSEGRFVAYECSTNLYCWDRIAAVSLLMNTNYLGTGGANGPCHSPQFTPGSRYCVFLSSATNLVPTTAGRCIAVTCKPERLCSSAGIQARVALTAVGLP